jgi:hypothetical protein
MTQLLEYSPSLREKLSDLKGKRSVNEMRFDEMWKMLLQTVKQLDRVYFVVDALDRLDVEYADGFLQRLVTLGKECPHMTKMILTSRPLSHILKHLNSLYTLQCRVECHKLDEDISLYVGH